MDFVVGHPRSGTTLIAELLSAAEPGVCVHEHLAQLTPDGVVLPTRYYEGGAEAAAVRALLARYRETPSVRIDSSWTLTWILPVLLEVFPDARILYLTRDPRENVRSTLTLDYYGELRHRPAFAGDTARNFWLAHMPAVKRDDWGTLPQLARNCAFWTESHRLLAALAGRPRTLRVSLEALAGDPAALDAVIAFFGLPPLDPAVRARLQATRVNERVEVKARVAAAGGPDLGPFATWPREAQATLVRECGPTAARLGYAL